jgi:hypothetical protein
MALPAASFLLETSAIQGQINQLKEVGSLPELEYEKWDQMFEKIKR